MLRDGARVSIDAAEVVPGDVVLLEAGDKVPADLRILEAHGLSAQESILTGESVPVEKSSSPVAHDAVVAERRSMLWSGTLVTQGTGRGVVVSTGSQTEVGRIGGLLAEVEQMTTPPVDQMDVFARQLSGLILLASVVLVVYGYFVVHRDFVELFTDVGHGFGRLGGIDGDAYQFRPCLRQFFDLNSGADGICGVRVGH